MEDQVRVGKNAGVSELSTRRSSDITARIGCLPCQHTSARGPFDRGHTLWASWSVESGGKKVWFGGYVIMIIMLLIPLVVKPKQVNRVVGD